MCVVKGWLILMPSVVLTTAAEAYGVEVEDFIGLDRHRPLATQRQVAMAAVKEACELSFPQTAREFGRDHTTVIHAVRKVTANPELIRQKEAIVAEAKQRWTNGAQTGASFT